MATITSTQSGPFDVGSTWVGGTAPVDGDSFVVAQGHIVAVTGDNRLTNGFNDSTVQGKLHIQGSGCMLRMNGQLTIDSVNSNTYFTEGVSSAPYFLMDPGSILELRGTNADAHRLWVNPEQRITVEILGTHPHPQTTLTASASGVVDNFSFTDASKFAPGDWISVYMPERTGLSWAYYRSDEGFWIHDIDNNDVYVKRFVGPEATITAVSANQIVVDDASVFRVGYQIIFGTGNNRNVRTITAIGYGSNTITLNSNVTGSVVGEKAYQTGVEKAHLSGDQVLQIAAVTTADAAVGDNTITVNNTNGFSVGDLILIQPNSDSYTEVGYWDYICDYTITNINTSTKVITFTNGYTSTTQTTLQKVTKAGALVVNISRDTQIRAPEGTTYGTDQRSSIYFQGGDVYYRRFKIKNTLINIGSHSDSNNYACIGMRGGSSYDLTSYGQYTSEFDGNVIMPVYRTTRNTGYLWEQHQLVLRNSVSYNAYGEGFYTYGNHRGFFSNVIMRCNGWGLNNGSYYEPLGETSYNYVSFCGAGLYASQNTEFKNPGVHTSIIKNVGTAIGGSYHYGITTYRRMHCDRYLYLGYGDRMSHSICVDSYTGNKWDVTGYSTGGAYSDSVQTNITAYHYVDRGSAHANLITSLCDNFKYNGMKNFCNTALRIWEEDTKSWRVYPDRDNSASNWHGFSNDVFLPANSVLHIAGEVKTQSGNTNYPYIYVDGCDYYNGWYLGQQTGSWGTAIGLSESDPRVSRINGFVKFLRFTSASVTNFETKTMTIGPFAFDCYITVAIAVTSPSTGNGRLGWREKNLKLTMTNPNGFTMPWQMTHFLTTSLPITYGTSTDDKKTIWGG